MLEEIKKIQGICNDEFDTIIQSYIDSCKVDLKAMGIVEEKVNEKDSLIRTAIFTYVMSFLDVNNSEMYSSSYNQQIDKIRHHIEYIEVK